MQPCNRQKFADCWWQGGLGTMQLSMTRVLPCFLEWLCAAALGPLLQLSYLLVCELAGANLCVCTAPAVDILCDKASFLNGACRTYKTLILYFNVLTRTQWKCLQEMLLYFGPVPLPVLDNASCPSTVLQAQHQDSCQDAEDCRDVGTESRKVIFSSHCQHFHC